MLPKNTTECTLPLCPRCNKETEWREFHIGSIYRKRAARCPECEEAVKAEQEAMAEAARAKEVREAHKAWMEELLEQSRLGRRYAECELTNFQPIKGTEVALAACHRFVSEFDPENGEGIILEGASGSGKSHLAAGIVKALSMKGYTAIFQSVPELLARLKATYDKGNNDAGEAEIMDALGECELLVLDDVGAEKPSAWSEERLYLLIDRRYRNKKATIITTNLAVSELDKALGIRATDRLTQTCKAVKLTAPSYRRRARN